MSNVDDGSNNIGTGTARPTSGSRVSRRTRVSRARLERFTAPARAAAAAGPPAQAEAARGHTRLWAAVTAALTVAGVALVVALMNGGAQTPIVHVETPGPAPAKTARSSAPASAPAAAHAKPSTAAPRKPVPTVRKALVRLRGAHGAKGVVGLSAGQQFVHLTGRFFVPKHRFSVVLYRDQTHYTVLSKNELPGLMARTYTVLPQVYMPARWIEVVRLGKRPGGGTRVAPILRASSKRLFHRLLITRRGQN
ncbi:MAG: hypothetical protein QOJ29_1792 [Thermoleophilaceae bacterium]|jgi:hypothetical protein|nr:hypothetical protein [Thermoleophilaceae bacterium]